jgi:hypothetical protein
MQLAWGADEIAFRDELVAFLDEHTPREMGSGRDYADDGSGAYADEHDIIPEWSRRWQATLFDHGWMIPGYPPELGGRNATPVQTLVYLEEMAHRRLPRSLHFPGYAIVAPSLLIREDEQKRPARRDPGDTVWCIADGQRRSDLAGLQTRWSSTATTSWSTARRCGRATPVPEVLLLRAHRSRRPQAQGDQPAHRRHGHARQDVRRCPHLRRGPRRGVLHRRIVRRTSWGLNAGGASRRLAAARRAG